MPSCRIGDTSVLRDAPLGDVHFRHDLEARDQRGLNVLRHRHGLVQDAVDAVADTDAFDARLDVDVRGFLADRLLHDGVGDADDRRFFGDLLQFGVIVFVTRPAQFAQLVLDRVMKAAVTRHA